MDRPDVHRESFARAALHVAALVALFFVVGGAPAPQVNETQYLVEAKRAWDPAYCPGDFFLGTAAAHTLFFWSVGWLGNFISLTAMAWVGRVAAWTLLAFGWRRLWLDLNGRRHELVGSLLSAALFLLLIDKCSLAGEWVVGGVEGKCFAYGLMMFGLAAIVRGDWRAPWIWFGGAAAYHVLVGGWAVLTAAGTWLFDRRKRDTPLPQLAAGIVAGGLLSLFGLLPALALTRGVDPAVSDEGARIYCFERLAHHLAPLELPAEEIRTKAIRFGALSLVFLCLWLIARRNSRRGGDLAQFAVPDHAARTPLDDDSLPAVARRILPLMLFTGVALGFEIAGLAIEWALRDQQIVAARILRYYWFRQADVVVPLAIALGLATWAVRALKSRWLVERAVAAAPMLWCTWQVMAIAVARLHNPVSPGLKNSPAPIDWIAACYWIDEHAPADAQVFIPRDAQSFKWFASRADLGNWKDVPQDAAGVIEWKRRMHELFELETIEGGKGLAVQPAELGTRRVRELAEKYDATFILTAAEPPLALRQVFPAASHGPNEYAIYAIDAKAGGDSAAAEPAAGDTGNER